MYAGCAALASTLIAALFPRSDACEVVSLDRKWLGAQTDGLKARGHWQGQDEGIFSFTWEPPFRLRFWSSRDSSEGPPMEEAALERLRALDSR
jgi:hypothetical protein